MLDFIFIFASGFLSAIWLIIMFWSDKPRDPYERLDQSDVRLTSIKSEYIRTFEND
jgi:hypothetical protein